MNFKHNSARKALGGWVAAGVLASTVFAGSASLPAFAAPTAAPIVGDKPAGAGDGIVSYAVNLASSSTAAQLTKAQQLAQESGATLMQTWPQINTFFVQTGADKFSSVFAAKAAAAGVEVVSVGPTRQAALEDYEILPGAAGSTATKPTVKPDTQTAPDAQPNTPPVSAPADKPAANPQQPAADAPDAAADAPDSAADTAEPTPATPGDTASQQGVSLADVTPDPSTEKAWGVIATGALAAQDVPVKLERVVVGVIDDGIDSDHEDLAANVDKSLSVDCSVNGIPSQENERWKPAPNGSHGTHVAGSIAAAHNGIGVDGVAPNATLAAVRIYHDDLAMPEHAVCGFMWAGLKKFSITNNSYYVDPWSYWLPNEPSQAAGYESVRRAAEWSQQQGVLHIAAAGNSDQDLDNIVSDDESPNDIAAPLNRIFAPGDNPIDVPGQLPGVIAVSSVALPKNGDPLTAELARSGFSNYGVKSVTVAAPGSRILSTVPGNKYAAYSGTSMASPHAAGVAALIKSVNPNLSAAQVAELLKKHAAANMKRLAEPTDGKEYRGVGFVSALDAVLKDQPQPVIGALESSADGGKSWSVVSNGQIDIQEGNKALVRVNVTGPVTLANLSEGTKVLAEQNADGSFDGSVVLVTEVAAPTGASSASSFEVKAFGRNADARADDDVSKTINFVVKSVKAEQKKPVAVVADQNVDKANNSSDPVKSATKDKAKDKKLANTGSENSALVGAIVAGMLMVAGIAASVVSRRRQA